MNLDSLSFALSQISQLVATLTKKNYKSASAELNNLVATHGSQAEEHFFRCLFSHVDFSGNGRSVGTGAVKDYYQIQLLSEQLSLLLSKPSFISVLCFVFDNPLHHQRNLRPSEHLVPQVGKVLGVSHSHQIIIALALLNSSNPELKKGVRLYLKASLPDVVRAICQDSRKDPVPQGVSSFHDLSVELVHYLLHRLFDPKDAGGLGPPIPISGTTEQSQTSPAVAASTKPAAGTDPGSSEESPATTRSLPLDLTDEVVSVLRSIYSRERAPEIFIPFLYPHRPTFATEQLNPNKLLVNKFALSNIVADIIMEVGPANTANRDTCRDTLSQIGMREINPSAVATTLGMMARNPTGGGSEGVQIQTLDMPHTLRHDKDKPSADCSNAQPTWKVEVFVQCVQELAPTLIWKEVVRGLDHPAFAVPGRPALHLLVTAFRKAFRDKFPVEELFQPWTNVAGQLGWIVTALKHPDVFCFADHQTAHVASLDALKSPPDEDNKDIMTWKSLDLVETLLRLADLGHQKVVSDLFKYPTQHCPDVLTLTLLQTARWNQLKYELLGGAIPFFLGNHPNSASVLQYSWHFSGVQHSVVQQLVMQSMADYYKRGTEAQEQTRLSRVLDVAHDLKALHILLEARPFTFVIDLACLASRREYLKLEKWLADKIREHGELFMADMVKFLKRRCPQLLPNNKESAGGAVGIDGAPGPGATSATRPTTLAPETIAVMLTRLKASAGNLQAPEVTREIMAMLTTAGPMLSKQLPPQRVGPVGASAPPTPGASGPLPPGVGPSGVGGLPQGMQQPPPSVSLPGSNGPQSGPPGQAGMGPGGGLPKVMGMAPMEGSGLVPGMGAMGGLGAPGSSPAKFPGSNQPPPSGNGPSGQNHFNLTGQFQNMSLQNPGRPQQQPPPAQIQQQNQAAAAAAKMFTGGPAGSGVPGAGPSGVAPGGMANDPPNAFAEAYQFTKEVEDEANSYFHKIYSQPAPLMSSVELLEVLKQLKDSPKKTERDVFTCILRNLFEEYRFFAQYPEKELTATAELYGGIIDLGLVQYMALGYALRYILAALQKEPDTKIFRNFGLVSLDRFKGRLKDYPTYCNHLVNTKHFKQFPPQLIEYIEYGMQSQEPPRRGPPPALPAPSAPNAVRPFTSASPAPSSSATSLPSTPQSSGLGAIGPNKQTKPSIANTTNIDTLVAGINGSDTSVITPPESIVDKIYFIFNNLAPNNMGQKAGELIDSLAGVEHWPWIAQYLVMKRVSIEPNYLQLYVSFLDKLPVDSLKDLVLLETHRNIRVLLTTLKQNYYADRSLLKNLGIWLGLITVAKNRPILYDDIDLKSLLLEAYNKGATELHYVVPFVAKVVECTGKSRIFKPPNPWTMGLMSVLAELHREPTLKLNLKFEIEVLCKSLSLDLSVITPAYYLTDMNRYNRLDREQIASGLNSHRQPKQREIVNIHLPAPASSSDGSSGNHPGVPHHPTSGPNAGPNRLFDYKQGPPPSLPISNIQPPPHPNMSHQQQLQGGGVPAMVPEQQQAEMAARMSAAAAAGNSGAISQPLGSMPAQPSVASAGSGMVPQAKYTYGEVTSASLSSQIVVTDQIPLLNAHPTLKALIRPCVERATNELIIPTVERVMKVAGTVEELVKKDFALDGEEGRMKLAAASMTRFVSSGLALITCREPVVLGLCSNLRSAFTAHLGPALQDKQQMDLAVQVVSQENAPLCCAFIQKTTSEKCVAEVHRRLSKEYELRMGAKAKNEKYYDPAAVAYQQEKMPEQVRSIRGVINSVQFSVYEQFARNVPGFRPLPDVVQAVSIAVEDLQEGLDRMVSSLDHYLNNVWPQQAGGASHPLNQIVRGLMQKAVGARQARDVQAGITLIGLTVESLMEHYNSAVVKDGDVANKFRDCHLFVLRSLQNLYKIPMTSRQITRALMEAREETRYNVDAVDALIRLEMVNLSIYDEALNQPLAIYLDTISKGGQVPQDYSGVAFVVDLLGRLFVDSMVDGMPSTGPSDTDFPNTIGSLHRMAALGRPMLDGFSALMETLRHQCDIGLLQGGPTQMMQAGIRQARDFDDPQGLQEKVEFLMREWLGLHNSPRAGRDSTQAFANFAQLLHSHGILKTDDVITRFFRISAEICVNLGYATLNDMQTAQGQAAQQAVAATQQEFANAGPSVQNSAQAAVQTAAAIANAGSPSATLLRNKCFTTLDAYVRLISLLIKHSGDSNNTITKVNLLNKVLGIMIGIMQSDQETRKDSFHQMPYHRMFNMLFMELNTNEHILEAINFQVLTAFCQAYHILRPAKCPGFAYSWLELISHRVFIGRLLALTSQQKGYPMYAQLIVDVLSFLAPFLRNPDSERCVSLLYKGTMRVMLLLLHDFPEFLCDHHYHFCDVIPPNCIQIKNLILSAFPRHMTLPDPCMPNLKVDMLTDISHPPRGIADVGAMIQPIGFRKDLDSYLNTRTPVTFLSDLRTSLQIRRQTSDGGPLGGGETHTIKYNVQLMNALLLYVGTQAIQYIQSRGQTPSMVTIAHSAHMDIFQNLCVDLDNEGRYLFLNSLTNQLRYPNSHTHYFSCVILYLFVEATNDTTREQIARVLLERLIVNRPHPWGLLVTFIELVKNRNTNFWSHGFVHFSPEIERLFDSVARLFIQRPSVGAVGQPLTGGTTPRGGGAGPGPNAPQPVEAVAAES